MKVLLVFPPFTLPTYVPLGIAQLKPYLDEKDVKVKCLDLNIGFHHYHFNGHATNSQANDFFHKSFTSDFFTKEYDELSRNFLFYCDELHGAESAKIEKFFSGDSECNPYFEHAAKIILAEKPDVVGFSNMLSSQWNSSFLLARLMKEINPKVVTVFGGSSFSLEIKDSFIPEFMDYLIYGEAEIAFRKLLDALKGQCTLSDVPNLVWNNSGTVTVNQRQEMKKMHEVPRADFTDYTLHSYCTPKPVIPIHASRSCPWHKCTYCVHYVTFKGYKARLVDDLVDEIEFYSKKGIHHFNFVDELLFPPYLRDLSKLLLERKIHCYWQCTTSPKDFTKEIFQLMHQAGCRLIYWGIESGSQPILDLMGKGTMVKDNEAVLHAAAETGINNYVMIIIGFPSETNKEFQETCAFLERNRKVISSVQVSGFFLYTQTDIYNHPEKYGITKIYEPDSVNRNFRYDIKVGLTYEQIVLLYNSHQKYFDSFTEFSNSFSILRDLALVYHSMDE